MVSHLAFAAVFVPVLVVTLGGVLAVQLHYLREPRDRGEWR